MNRPIIYFVDINDPDETGTYESNYCHTVLAADYDALLARAKTAEADFLAAAECNVEQRKTIQRFQTELATERLRADAAVGDANAAECRVAELEELMASQAKAIREEREAYAMSMKAQQPSGLVLPGRMTTIPEGKTISYAAGYEDALDAVASLNRTVSLELLERALSEKDSICRTLALRELRAILGAKS